MLKPEEGKVESESFDLRCGDANCAERRCVFILVKARRTRVWRNPELRCGRKLLSQRHEVSMQDWIQHILSSEQAGFAFYPALFLLGLLGSVSSCCTLPVVGAVLGYAGTRDTQNGSRDLWFTGLFFLLGTTLSLAVIGALTGLVGQMASTSLGRTWQFMAGLLIVMFGLVSLKLVPVRLPKFNFAARAQGKGLAGAMVYGLVLGGSTTACSVGCNPLLPMAIGAVVLQSTVLMGAVALGIFALGYSLPLAAGLVGISFGISRLGHTERLVKVIQVAGGVLLLGVGFYLLATL